jgi:methyl-accepting chemotaxis protein
MKRVPSLATKLTIALIIILFIAQGIGFLLFIISMRNNMLDSLDKKMKSTGNMLAGISVKPILEKDFDLLDVYLKEIIKDQDIISVKIFDSEKRLLGIKTKIPPKGSSGFNLFYIRPFFNSEFPIVSEDKKIGDISITSTSARIKNELLKHTFFGLMNESILLAILVLLVFEFFRKNIKKPLSDFVLAVTKLGSGDLTVNMRSNESLEMMVLAREFNKLASRLRDIIKKLYFTTNGVTMAINQLNRVIDKIMEGTNNQIKATEGTISVIEKADESQKRILSNTHELTEFSQENSASFTQIEAAAVEINEKTKELSRYSQNVYSTVSDLLQEAKAVTKSSEELLATSEQTTSAAEQISANIKEVKGRTDESDRLAFEVSKILSDIRMSALAEAVDSIDEVEAAVNEDLRLVKSLQTKSKDIEKILSVVRDVVKQTNLLSVNAAILAAQAGEYGSSFSVVADEIKNLADRTASSAKEITEIIKTVQNEIVRTIKASEDSMRIVKTSKDLILRIDSAIVLASEKAKSSSIVTKKIHKATEEQLKGTLQLNEAMELLTSVASRMVEIVHRQENKSQYILNITEKFKEISEFIKDSMQQQTTGVEMVSKNLVKANEMVKYIDSAVSEQDKANNEILMAADRIRMICNDTIKIAQEIRESFNNLYNEAERLKRDMEGFKIE